MNKTAIIGDIHGKADALKRLLNDLPEEIEQIYSVGDLIDRGTESKEVIQICIDNNILAVRGNHEDMFLDYLDGTGFYDEGTFENNGGMATLESYGGMKILDTYGSFYWQYFIPDDHKIYLESLPYFIETEDFILSHAGIHPLRATGEFGLGKWDDGSEKSNTDLMWNRHELAVMGTLQIVGHNPVPEVEYVKRRGELSGINIDTRCGKFDKAKLTAILIPTCEIIQVIS